MICGVRRRMVAVLAYTTYGLQQIGGFQYFSSKSSIPRTFFTRGWYFSWFRVYPTLADRISERLRESSNFSVVYPTTEE